MNLEIIPYRELDAKDDIFILWLKSFGFYGTPNWLERFGKLEPTLGEGPIGVCGLLDGKLVGFVGVMLIPTRTKTGERELVGGIYGIATRPAYGRQGIGRQLLEYAENWLREQGMRVVFLTTSRAIVAYRWYREVGYENVAVVDNYKYYYKLLSGAGRRPTRATPSKYRLDDDVVRDLFEWYARDRCGFVLRPPTHLKAREFHKIFDRKLSLSLPDGYALLTEGLAGLRYCELLAKTKKTYRELIRLAEARTSEAAVAIHPFDPKAEAVLLERGYACDPVQFEPLMVKSLDGTRFENLYDDSFMIAKIDWF
ncbi:MAG: GNAT family N-acetyltransferase [bacterium]